MINVLVTGVGGGVGQSILKALNLSKLELSIIGADMNLLSAGSYRVKTGYLVPPARSKDYINTIISICQKEKIDIVFIGSDPELPVISAHKKEIESDTGVILIVSSPENIAIGNDKWQTAQFLKKNGLPYPESALPEDVDNLIDKVGFPVFIKPREGSASRDVFVVNTQDELNVFIKRITNPVIQEYLQPVDEEYTSGVMVFNNTIFGSITLKREIKGGNTYRATCDSFPIIANAVTEVARKFNPFGPSNFQIKHTERGPVVFEINPRMSGTTCMRAFFGFNEPEFIINYLINGVTQPLSTDRGIAVRYMNEVYIPFSDYTAFQTQGVCRNQHSTIPNYF